MNNITQAKVKKQYIDDFCTFLFNTLKSNEKLNVNINGEEDLFLRYNNSKVRQVTKVNQSYLNLTLMSDDRTIKYSVPLVFNDVLDRETAVSTMIEMRKDLKLLPEDTFQVPMKNNGNSEENFYGEFLSDENLMNSLLSPLESGDFTGVYTHGPHFQANQNSLGQNHWFYTENFYADYSLYNKNQKAVKGLYAGNSWNQIKYQDEINKTMELMKHMDAPDKNVPRGKYRTYFAPAATAEFLSTLSWKGVSYSAAKKGNGAFMKLLNNEIELSPLFNLNEDFRLSLAPRFNGQGEIAPEKLSLIESGKLKNLMISSRTAKEYGIPSNGSGAHEGMRSPVIAAGNLKEEDILKTLGTGIYVSNLHYLNWSDIQNARITGMTRYACFWVENGKIVSPIKDLRFDESLFSLWGKNLECLTNFIEVVPNTGSYGGRSFGGMATPGMIVNDFSYTL